MATVLPDLISCDVMGLPFMVIQRNLDHVLLSSAWWGMLETETHGDSCERGVRFLLLYLTLGVNSPGLLWQLTTGPSGVGVPSVAPMDSLSLMVHG